MVESASPGGLVPIKVGALNVDEGGVKTLGLHFEVGKEAGTNFINDCRCECYIFGLEGGSTAYLLLDQAAWVLFVTSPKKFRGKIVAAVVN